LFIVCSIYDIPSQNVPGNAEAPQHISGCDHIVFGIWLVTVYVWGVVQVEEAKKNEEQIT